VRRRAPRRGVPTRLTSTRRNRRMTEVRQSVSKTPRKSATEVPRVRGTYNARLQDQETPRAHAREVGCEQGCVSLSVRARECRTVEHMTRLLFPSLSLSRSHRSPLSRFLADSDAGTLSDSLSSRLALNLSCVRAPSLASIHAHTQSHKNGCTHASPAHQHTREQAPSQAAALAC